MTILGFIGERLHLIDEPSMRHYENARQMKEAKQDLDWRSALLETFGLTPEKVAVAQLRADSNYPDGEARVAEFTRRTGRSRATYFRITRRLGR